VICSRLWRFAADSVYALVVLEEASSSVVSVFLELPEIRSDYAALVFVVVTYLVY
jgi:hypothetical protein